MLRIVCFEKRNNTQTRFTFTPLNHLRRTQLPRRAAHLVDRLPVLKPTRGLGRCAAAG